MNVWSLSWRYLWSRPWLVLLNALLLSLGLATVALVLLAQDQVQRAFERDLAGIDLVVGAKGSPLQLILAGVFHLDVPPGNVALADVQVLQQHPQVAQWIPLSLGDNVAGFRIVGTTLAYPEHYGATLAQGQFWQQPMQAVLGAQVAAQTGWGPGQRFLGSHGLVAGGFEHPEAAYTVTGVLKPCGCVLDRLVLTATESVWQVHEDLHATDDSDAEDRAALVAEREITLALVRYSTPLAAISLPRFINDRTGLQAAAPALEITRLFSLLGVGVTVLQGLGVVLLAVAGLSVLVGFWAALRERQHDLALLRLLGASPSKLALLLLCEALWLAVIATGLGLLLAHGVLAALGVWLMAEQALPLTGWYWVPAEGWVPVLALGVAVLAAALPVWTVYRQDVVESLNSR